MSTLKNVMVSVWLAALFLGSLAVYDQGVYKFQGGNLVECYETYATLVLFFAIVGVVFFVAMVFYLAIDLFEKLRK